MRYEEYLAELAGRQGRCAPAQGTSLCETDPVTEDEPRLQQLPQTFESVTVGAKDLKPPRKERRDLEPLCVRESAVAGVERVKDQLERLILVAGHQVRSGRTRSVEKNTKKKRNKSIPAE
jgi:hypothetical protein